MSKKSRKRNRKILGALAAGLGAMALMRGRGTPAAANVDSGRGGTSSSAEARVAANAAAPAAPAVTGTVYPGANKVVTKKSSWPYRSSRAAGDYGVEIAPKRVNNVLVKNRINAEMGRKTPFHPSQGNLYNPGFTMEGDRRGWKSGGKVKGCGVAKRGLGRAFTKSKK